MHFVYELKSPRAFIFDPAAGIDDSTAQGKYQQLQQRKIHGGATVYGLSIEDCYRAVNLNQDDFLGDQADYFRQKALEFRGFQAEVVTEDRLSLLITTHA